uniref:Cathepsin W n=1 Tax=Catagonus wagneri TaxID=51154 RepID=A0A8C3WCG4_9CETA
MALTAHLCCLLALLVAGQVQGTKDFLGSQAPGPQPMGLKETFTLFQIQYNRSYSNPAEHARRLDIFARNLAQAQRLQEEDLGTAEFGVTPFSDLSEEEFGQLYRRQQVAGKAPRVDRKVGSEEAGETVPRSCDWRKKPGIVSAIRNQNDCQCCWAMAAADNIEAQWAIKHSKPGQLSVQQLLDCDRCGNGCNGGFVWDAFLTVLNNSGLASEKDYPFKGKAKTHRCLAKEYKKVAWIQDFFTLPSSEQSIARYLATEGPITVTVTASLLQQYRSGVLKGTHDNCDPESVDHSVLLVGFGRSKPVEGRRPRPRHSLPYWILKNSWGPDWGEGVSRRTGLSPPSGPDVP